MRDSKCLNCGKESYGSNRRKFCCESCRVNHWQKGKRKPKLTRPKFAKLEEETVEQAQFRIFASMMTVKAAALKGDELAISVLKEIDRQLTNIAKELK